MKLYSLTKLPAKIGMELFKLWKGNHISWHGAACALWYLCNNSASSYLCFFMFLIARLKDTLLKEDLESVILWRTRQCFGQGCMASSDKPELWNLDVYSGRIPSLGSYLFPRLTIWFCWHGTNSDVEHRMSKYLCEYIFISLHRISQRWQQKQGVLNPCQYPSFSTFLAMKPGTDTIHTFTPTSTTAILKRVWGKLRK